MDEQEVVDAHFLDFSKASDTVLHSILLDRLSNCGMSETTCHCRKNWLNRGQSVLVNGAASEWWPVTSSVSWDSILEPVLFCQWSECKHWVMQVLSAPLACLLIPKCEVLLNLWRGKMPCRGIYLEWMIELRLMGWNLARQNARFCISEEGESKAGHRYKLEEEWLESCPAERDLEILVNKRFNTSHQCALAAKRANSTLGCTEHSITCQSKDVIMPLYSVLVQPHQLWHCMQFWAPQFKKGVKVPECIQKMAAKLLKVLWGLNGLL